VDAPLLRARALLRLLAAVADVGSGAFQSAACGDVVPVVLADVAAVEVQLLAVVTAGERKPGTAQRVGERLVRARADGRALVGRARIAVIAAAARASAP